MPNKILKKIGRKIYKATGYKNPMKNGRISTTRLTSQIPKLLKDVSRMQAMINSEKFRIETKFDNQIVGQINENASGHYVLDVTPAPSQGDNFNSRQGNSIKWVSSHYSFLFQKMSGLTGNVRGTIEFIKVIGEPLPSTSNLLGRFIERNRWIDNAIVYDIAADRKPEYFKNFKVIRTINFSLKASDFSGQLSQKIINCGFKLKNHHVKWNNNTATVAEGQVLMLIRLDTGNCNQTNASTLDNVTNLAANTGLIMAHNRLDYYYDN